MMRKIPPGWLLSKKVAGIPFADEGAVTGVHTPPPLIPRSRLPLEAVLGDSTPKNHSREFDSRGGENGRRSATTFHAVQGNFTTGEPRSIAGRFSHLRVLSRRMRSLPRHAKGSANDRQARPVSI